MQDRVKEIGDVCHDHKSMSLLVYEMLAILIKTQPVIEAATTREPIITINRLYVPSFLHLFVAVREGRLLSL
jgi:hypothetical protein